MWFRAVKGLMKSFLAMALDESARLIPPTDHPIAKSSQHRLRRETEQRVTGRAPEDDLLLPVSCHDPDRCIQDSFRLGHVRLYARRIRERGHT